MAKAPLVEAPEGQEPRDASAIKDAYSQWLKEMHHAAPRKRKSKKKSMRIAALRHLQQPTQSSAKKHISSHEPETAPTIPVAVSSDEAAAALQEAQRRRFQVLADEANYSHYQHEAPWCPGLAFFALLASHAQSKASVQQGALRREGSKPTRSEIPTFPVRVPPTVLRLSSTDGVVLMFTTEQQPPEDTETRSRSMSTTAHRRSELSSNNNQGASRTSGSSDWTLQFHFFRQRETFEGRMPWILRVLTAESADSSALAVLKTTSEASPLLQFRTCNHVELLSPASEVECALRNLWDESTSGGELKAIQTFVQSKGGNNSSSIIAAGGTRAWIARPAYRKKDQSATTVWILTGDDPHFASTQWSQSETSSPCQIVKCVNAQSWQEPRVIVKTLCQCLDMQVLRSMGAGALAELVVDLVQDRHGHWWLLQVKALQLRRSHLPPTVSVKDTSRARSAPDRLETMSVASTSAAPSKFASMQSRPKWKCAGKYCYASHDEQVDFLESGFKGGGPSGYLTKKEVLSCEFYDKYRSGGDASVSNGCTSLSNALAFYLQHQLHKRDRAVLYEPQPLCGACIRKYHVLRSQCAEQVGLESTTSPEVPRKQTKRKSDRKRVASQSLGSFPSDQLHASHPVLPPLLPLTKSVSMPDAIGLLQPVAAPSYLDELDRIERLLNGDEDSSFHQSLDQVEPQDCPRQPTSQPASRIQDEAPAPGASATSTSTLSWLQNPTREDRVDEMWQSVQLKPLSTTMNRGQVAGSRVYNTFSLQAALREGMDERLRPTVPSLQQSSEHHLISITDSRRVFSDDGFRESLAREAVLRLTEKHQSVRFVVLRADDQVSGASCDSSVGRMALRSIALDIAQLLDQEGTDSGFSASGLPPLVDDAAGSGCLLMTIDTRSN